jgi:hypothetical protein
MHNKIHEYFQKPDVLGKILITMSTRFPPELQDCHILFPKLYCTRSTVCLSPCLLSPTFLSHPFICLYYHYSSIHHSSSFALMQLRLILFKTCCYRKLIKNMSHATYYVISTLSLRFVSSVSTSRCTYTLASMIIVVEVCY